MEKMFADYYVIYVYSMAAVSFGLNLLLSVVICLSQNKAGQYFKYTVSFIAADFLYSLECILTMPYWFQYPRLCAIFSVSPLPFPATLQASVMEAWWSCILGVVILASASFIHRHAIVCNSILQPFFASQWGVSTIFMIPITSVFYVKIGHYALSKEDDILITRLNEDVGSQLGIDFRTSNLLAINFEDIGKSTFFTTGFMLLGTSMTLLYLGIVYCALTMNQAIKKVTISGNLKMKQMKALRILILQTINPFLFIYGPFIVIFVASLLQLSWHWPEKVADLFIHLFPINNAIIILTMTDEYRQTMLKKARLPTSSDRSLVQSRIQRVECQSVLRTN